MVGGSKEATSWWKVWWENAAHLMTARKERGGREERVGKGWEERRNRDWRQDTPFRAAPVTFSNSSHSLGTN